MDRLFFNLIPIVFLFSFISCNLDMSIDFDMDEHQKEVVVECYLEPGEQFRLVLSETSNYLDETSTPFIYNADVIIYYDNKVVQLKPNHLYVQESRKFYNFTASDTVPELYDTDFHIKIEAKGKTIEGTTRMVKPKKITQVTHTFNSEGNAFINLAFEKDLDKQNFYRLVINRDSIRGINYTSLALHSEQSPQKNMQFSTGYDFSKDETVVIRVYHITPEYYNFLESVQNAIIANVNPFSQPNAILSNLKGAVGIFTALNYDIKEVVLE